MSVPPPPALSPDGKFYWDGERWLPYIATATDVPVPPHGPSAKPRQIPSEWQTFADWYVWARRNVSTDDRRCLAAAIAATRMGSGDGGTARKAAFDGAWLGEVPGLPPTIVAYAHEIYGLAGTAGNTQSIQQALASDDPIAAARQAMSDTTATYLAAGYRITSQTDAMIQLVRPKRFSLFWSLAWFLVFGVGILVYVLYFLAKRDDTVALFVDPNGRLTISKT